MKILTARTAIQTALKAITRLNALTPMLERDGDITSTLDADMGTHGMALVVMAPSGAVKSESKSGSAASLEVPCGIAVLENPNVNFNGTTGIAVASEDAFELIVSAIMGLDRGNEGQITLTHEPWKRISESDGMIVNVIGFHIPISMRHGR